MGMVKLFLKRFVMVGVELLVMDYGNKRTFFLARLGDISIVFVYAANRRNNVFIAGITAFRYSA